MKRALIVVDYQRDFVTGSLGFPGAVALAERIAKKIAAYHKSGDVVLFTMDTHTDNYLNTQEESICLFRIVSRERLGIH